MGFWSKLGKGLAIGGAGLGTLLTAGAASPALAGALGMTAGGAATGGAAATAGSSLLSKLAKGASAVSKVIGPLASGAAAGAQKGREAENSAAQDEALFKLKESGQHEDQLMDRQTLALRQKERAEAAQKNAYELARRSALAKNMKDVTVSGVPTGPIKPGAIPTIRFDGGLRPSAYGQEGQDAATEMHRQAMKKLMEGESFDTLPGLERVAPPAFKKPGALENIAGGLALSANAINNYGAQKGQSALTEKILAAIESLNGGQAAPAGATFEKVSKLAGVTPFWKPPTAKLTGIYDPDADSSNR